ncbi:alpha/beta fold hydrolase [Paradesertivirga mongoliensis]|uniref:Alpha/beta fold hydrolase n=1 Tax=Paradesertivirga mongoliensis TaxID=2100740 RepID=A0ABW4ZMP6_9SPHI|nr:alpha/beta hydrolase [Pedobacter mongoliensis]
MKLNLPQLLIALFVVLASHSSFGQLLPPANYRLTKDLIYKEVGNWTWKMDLYVPKEGAGDRPLLIFIHGGGWVHGKKEQERDFGMFFEKNFVIANIEYRVANQAVAPAAIEDSRCALHYLVREAGKLRIDRKKIVLMGISAGAHLALMTAFTSHDPVFARDCAAAKKRKFRIAAVIDWSGPSDLNQWDVIRKPGKASRDWLGGRENDTSFVNFLSPVSYIRAKSPPVLIAHGEKDRTVPFEQSSILYSALKNAGVFAELHALKNAGHSFSREDRDNLKVRIFDFLGKLKVIR